MCMCVNKSIESQVVEESNKWNEMKWKNCLEVPENGQHVAHKNQTT